MNEETRKKRRFERVREHFKTQAVREHVEAHREAYVAGALAFLAGGTTVLVMGRRPEVQAVQKIIGGIVWHPTQTLEQTTLLVRRGHPGFIMLVRETGEEFASKNRVAALFGVNRRELAKIPKGESRRIGDYTFENLGEAAA